MITLNSHILSNYLKTGTEPRLFCEVLNSSGDQIMLIGSKKTGDYEDMAKSWGTISGSVDKYGGFAEKTGLSLEGYLLGSRLPLCTEATLNPRIDILTNLSGAGKLMVQGTIGVSFADVRNATSGSISTVGVVVGRQKVTTGEGEIYYRNQRGYLQFKVPAGITTCEEAVIEFDGQADFSATDFDIQLFSGSWTHIINGMYNDFDGWVASGAYTGTVLNETWNTAQYSGTAKNKIRLNAAGRQYLIDNAGSTVHFLILSKNDVNNSAAPSGNEFVQFASSTTQLKIRYNSQTLDNQEARVYLCYEPVSTSNFQRIYTGVVDDFTITPEMVSLSLKQNDFKKDVLIPKKVITEADFPDCPENNIGKAFPIIYGNFDNFTGLHKTGVGYIETINNPAGTTIHYNHTALSYPQDTYKSYVIADNKTSKTLLLCGHPKQWGAPVAEYNQDNFRFIFTWNSSLSAYSIMPVSSATTTYTDSDGYQQIITPLSLSEELPDILCEGKFKVANTIIPIKTINVNAINPEYAIDENGTNYATLTANNSYIDFIFSNMQDSSGSGGNVFIAKAMFVDGMAASDLHIYLLQNQKIKIEDIDNFQLTDVDIPWVDNGQEQYAFIDVDPTDYKRTPIQLEQYAIRIQKKTATGSARIFNVCAMAADDANSEIEFYSHGFGRPDDTSGTITGTAYDLIENPSHVIESLARDEMNLIAAEIDTSSLDTAATQLTDWVLAFELLDRKQARDIINSISTNIKSKIWWDNYNRLKMLAFDSTRGFAVSGTDIPGNLDIFDITGSPVSNQWTTNPIIDGVTISRVSLDDTYNDFAIKYRKNYASGEYQEILTMDNGLGVVGDVITSLESADESDMENSQTIAGLSALCAESYSTYGVKNTLEFECEYIRSRATAVKIMQYLIERYSKRRYQVSFTTKQTALAKEFGDYINVRTKWTDKNGVNHNGRLEDLFGEATVELKKWEIIDRDYNIGTQEITIKAIEV